MCIAGSMTDLIQGESYAIEKFHPAFYDFQAHLLLSNLEEIERQEAETIKLVYQVRDPRSAINSYINYQKRDPEWHAHPDQMNPFHYMERSYKSLQELAEHRRGMIIDYGDLVENLTATLASIYRYLWPQHDEALLLNVAVAAQEFTDRKKRQQGFKTKFLAQRAGTVKGTEAQYAPLFRAHRDEVEACLASYSALLALGSAKGDGRGNSTGKNHNTTSSRPQPTHQSEGSTSTVQISSIPPRG